MAQDFTQNSEQYVSHIDVEIERLQQLRNQVAEAIEGEKQIAAPKTERRGMSAEGRLRVAEAQKARWAKQKRAAKRAAKADLLKPAERVLAKQVVTKKTRRRQPQKRRPIQPLRTTGVVIEHLAYLGLSALGSFVA